MREGAHVLDLGFGTGFPLIELAQRFGRKSLIYGVDIWKEGIAKTERKIDILELDNIIIFEKHAKNIPLGDQEIDLVVSNLGINNFSEKDDVFKEVYRVMKPEAELCLCTNPDSCFHELFAIFSEIASELNLPENLVLNYIKARGNVSSLKKEFSNYGFELVKYKEDEARMRFVNAQAVLDHSLIRIGFRESWDSLIPKEHHDEFYTRLLNKIDKHIHSNSEFNMHVPVLYMQFKKRR